MSVGSWNVVLGHNRLSIIDLTPSANQPLWDHTGRFALVYNGEVYNYVELKEELISLGHRFRTRSDSEVIIEAFKTWGAEAFSRLNGMFAFALLDCEQRLLWLVRDRFGVKPLYFHHTRSTFAFGSMMTPLACELGLEPDLEYCARGLHYYIFDCGDDRSAFAGLQAVRPGHFLQVDLGNQTIHLTSRCYYELNTRVREKRAEIAGRSEAEMTRAVYDLVADAVRLRLRSDVPVALSLSGGLDSATIAACLSEFRRDVTGFNFGSPAVGDSEGPAAALLAQARSIEVQYVWPSSKEIVESFAETLGAQDAPFPGGAVIAQNWVYAAARKAGFKVILGGQGGDEAFMGYRKFHAFHLRHLMRSRRLAAAGAFGLSLMPMLLSEGMSLGRYWRHRSRYLDSQGFRSIVQLPSRPLPMGAVEQADEWIRQAQDVQIFSLPTLLRYEDRNSMSSSVESRLPFMDFRVMELGLALAPSMKLRGGYGKWILRSAVKGLVPDEIRLARFKKGFNVSEERWIREGLGHFLRDELRQVWTSVCHWLAPEFRSAGVDAAFSDDRLAHVSNAFAEAVTLIWLGRHSSETISLPERSSVVAI